MRTYGGRPSTLGPTRYQPRCTKRVRSLKRPCWAPLDAGQHVGICQRCREQLLAALKLRSLLYGEVRSAQATTSEQAKET
jgi:hypothetical protein